MHQTPSWPRVRVAANFLPTHARVLLIALLALVIGGCTDPEAMRLFEQLAAQNQAILAAQGADPSNRLLIQGIDGNLYTIRPDGSERVALTNDASSRRQYLQPTWSPTGKKIAWAAIDNRTGNLQSSLTVSQFDGLAREHFDTPYAPFYMQWSPDETRLAYLSNWLNLNQTTATIALRLVDFAADPKIRTLTEGQPLYMSWSPVGDRILIHIDNDRLEFWDVAGEGAALITTRAAFPAPQWANDGASLLYALGDGTDQQLVIGDADGNVSQSITDYDQQISFSLSPTNDRVAYATTPDNIGTAAFGPLYVVELESERTREISRVPVMAFYWSPDGTKLAYLVVDSGGDVVRLRWHVWDGTTSKAFAPIVPSRLFLQSYVAFFDQYTRSMNIWSPDSNAFAYPAVDESTGSHIWVQRLEDDEPTRISRGVFVAWSPR